MQALQNESDIITENGKHRLDGNLSVGVPGLSALLVCDLHVGEGRRKGLIVALFSSAQHAASKRWHDEK